MACEEGDCKPAYSVACNPRSTVASPCDPARSDDFPDPDPEEVDPPEIFTPPCVSIVHSTADGEIEEDYTYDANADRYTSDSGNVANYDAVFGYTFFTGEGNYTGISGATRSPYGTFQNAAGDTISTAPCP